MNHDALGHRFTLAFCMLALLTACDQLQSGSTPSDPTSALSPNDQRKVGAKLTVIMGLDKKNFVGSRYVVAVRSDNRYVWGYDIRILQSDSLLNATGSMDAWWKPRARLDTLKVFLDPKLGGDTLVYPMPHQYLTGFAPIESSVVRRFEKLVWPICYTRGGSRDTTVVTLTSLGAIEGGYRFERQEVGHRENWDGSGTLASLTPISRIDTIDLKMADGRVAVKFSGNDWAQLPFYEFPYFVQDTMPELSDHADENAYGYLKAVLDSGFFFQKQITAAYQSGRGLVEYNLRGFEGANCGPGYSGTTIRAL